MLHFRPVQEFLELPLDYEREQNTLARLLPDPLYVLFIQVKCEMTYVVESRKIMHHKGHLLMDTVAFTTSVQIYILCTGGFLYVRYSFLLISNKFCELSSLHWVGGGGGSAVRKFTSPPPTPSPFLNLCSWSKWDCRIKSITYRAV
jgi:hypothetical protein